MALSACFPLSWPPQIPLPTTVFLTRQGIDIAAPDVQSDRTW